VTYTRLRLAALSAGAGAVLAALLGARPELRGPAAAWSGTDVATFAAWAAAAACAAWIALVALACNVAFGRPRLERAAVRLAPRFVRRVAGVAVVGSTVLLAALPAQAAPAPDEPVVRAPVTTPARQPVLSVPRRHVVVPGDNLWRIARAELVARGDPAPTDETVARYWRAVIAANRATLRSGDPNLIFAGEVVALPPPR
jgi:hypothetical protein